MRFAQLSHFAKPFERGFFGSKKRYKHGVLRAVIFIRYPVANIAGLNGTQERFDARFASKNTATILHTLDVHQPIGNRVALRFHDVGDFVAASRQHNGGVINGPRVRD
ncbi:Uncharacterised protein [Vibrio cholerae]|nr:Uncharacterised protein [Vibrio cholerae]